MLGVESGISAQDFEGLGAQVDCLANVPVCMLEFQAPPNLDALSALPGVRYAEADALMQWVPPAELPAPPWDGSGTEDCPDLWELELLGAESLPFTGVNAPVVAIQDSGFLIGHEDLGSAKVSGKYDYILHVAVRDSDHLRDLALDSFTTREEVAQIETSLVFDRLNAGGIPVSGGRD